MNPSADSLVTSVVQGFSADRSRLMDIVQALQQHFGYLSDDVIQRISAALGVAPVEIEDMVTFYAFLSRKIRGRFEIRLSRTPISIMKGAQEIARAFEKALGLSMGETSADGAVTLTWTSDIGMADQEPAALVNAMVLTALTPQDVPAIVLALQSAAQAERPLLFPLQRAENAQAVSLPGETIRSSLVKAGPLLTGPLRRGAAIEAALARLPEAVIDEISASKLRGRGGAGFPTGMKWRACRKAKGVEHYIVCNADEGEPGTFKDRMLLSEFPDLVFDGMTIAAYAIGARQGLVYLRGEYAYLWQSLQDNLTERRAAGLLGHKILGREGFDFDIRVQLGAGAYVCGEESALVESLEGKRGAPRDRPPFPTERGYLQQPTAIDNVETFACVTRILEHGAAWFASYGTRASTGTKLMSVSGDCERPGVYEVPFGTSVNELLDLVGGINAEFVQVSGPSGQALAPKDFGRRFAYEDLSTGGSTMIFGPERDVLEVVRQFTEFFVDESCGWCVPCRVGTTLLKLAMDKIVAGRASIEDIGTTEALANTVTRMSRCGLGQTASNPILSSMRNFPHLFEKRLRPEAFVPRVTLREALGEAIVVQGREPSAEDF